MKPSYPMPWYTPVCRLLKVPARILFNVRVHNEAIRDLKGPFIAVSNHPCFMDWAFAALALRPHRVAFVVNRLYFRGPLGFLLNKIGAIPRSLMTSDAASVRRMLRLAREGVSMCMFPDPSISLVGETEGITSPGTYKFLRRLGLPVVGLRHEGSFYAKPAWGRGLRRGRVDTTATILFTPEQLQTLPEAEGEARLRALVEGRPQSPRERGVAYRSRRRAENLEKLFFLCPHCLAQGRLTTKGSRIRCEACGRSAELNEYYELVWDGGEGPESLAAWYDLQREAVLPALEEEGFVLETDTVFHRFTDETGFQPVGPGRLRLDAEGLHYLGADGETLFYPLDSLRPLFQKLSAGRVYVFSGVQCHEFELPDKSRHVNFWRLSVEHLQARANLN